MKDNDLLLSQLKYAYSFRNTVIKFTAAYNKFISYKLKKKEGG